MIDRPRDLTEIEREILRAVAGGITAKQIARLRSVSHRTVQNHLERIYQALGATNAPHAVAIAFRLGILR